MRGSASAGSLHFQTTMEAKVAKMRQKLKNGELKTIRKKGKSLVWDRFSEIVNAADESGAGYVICNSCNNIYAYDSHKTGTSALVRHACAKSRTRDPSQSPISSFIRKKIPPDVKSKFENDFVDMCCLDIRLVDIVSRKEFLQVAQALINIGAKYGVVDADSIIPHRKTLSDRCSSAVCAKIQELKGELPELIQIVMKDEFAFIQPELYCQEHKPQSHAERPNGKDEAAGLAHSSDSSLKRKQSSNGRQDKVPSIVGFKRKISSSSDDDTSFKSLNMIAPIESEDEEDSKAKINTPETHIDYTISRNDLENVCASTSGNECQSQDDCEDANETDISMAESQSLLLPVTVCMESESSRMTVPKPAIDSASFWKDFNEAGRTKAIFSDFIDELNDISGRIQSNQASQEDYDMALRVMEASGSLAVLVAKQDEEIKKKRVEVQIEEAAMKRIMSAMGR